MIQTNPLFTVIHNIISNLRESVFKPLKQLEQNWYSIEEEIDFFLTERQAEMDETWQKIEKRIKQ